MKCDLKQEGCSGLELPASTMLYCGHCNRRGCMRCVIIHNKKLTHANVQVPELLRRTA